MSISRANIGKEIKMAPSKKKLNIKKAIKTDRENRNLGILRDD